jgi:hypothetical protein
MHQYLTAECANIGTTRPQPLFFCIFERKEDVEGPTDPQPSRHPAKVIVKTTSAPIHGNIRVRSSFVLLVGQLAHAEGGNNG